MGDGELGTSERQSMARTASAVSCSGGVAWPHVAHGGAKANLHTLHGQADESKGCGESVLTVGYRGWTRSMSQFSADGVPLLPFGAGSSAAAPSPGFSRFLSSLSPVSSLPFLVWEYVGGERKG